MPQFVSGSPDGEERRRTPRQPGAGVVAYARFRRVPGIHDRYPDHDVDRWYPVLRRNEEAPDPLPGPDFVWLDMGTVRGVARDDLQIRPPDLDQPARP